MIVFGGELDLLSVPTLANAVWVMTNADGTAGTPGWKQLTPTGNAPSGRLGNSAVYDSSNNRLVVFGGNPNVGNCFVDLNDVWVLTNADGSVGTPGWVQLSPTGGAPGGRAHHSAVYDAANNRMVLFGGNQECSTTYNDVWVLANANGLGGTPTWTQLSPTGTAPASHSGHSAVYDATNNLMIVFGGGTPSGVVNDVWILSHANGLGGTPAWSLVTVSNAIPARSGQSAAYDAANNTMIVFGGVVASETNDLWKLTSANNIGGTPTWIKYNPAAPIPPARESQGAVYNVNSRKLILFGGIACPSGCTLFADVWAMDLTQAPVITAFSPTNQTLQCGSTASFSVTASGVAPLWYQWYYASSLLTGATNSTLAFTNISSAVSGQYSVVVSNSYGSVISPVISLVVTSAVPPVIALNGGSVVTNAAGTTFVDPGATAADACGNSLTSQIQVTGYVTSCPGTNILTYSVNDGYGHVATTNRIVVQAASVQNLASGLRFYAAPYRVNEGDAVRFIYIDNGDGTSIPVKNMISWQWDFNGDGIVDASSDTSTNIQATWYAVFDLAHAVNGLDTFTPTLTVVYTNFATCSIATATQTGITEPMYGIGTNATPSFFVLKRGVGNQDIQLAVSANPRLATNGQPVRFYLSTTMLNAGNVNPAQVVWGFGDGTSATGNNPQHVYTTNGLYDVSVQVTYSVTGPPAYTNTVYETNAGFIQIVSVPSELQLGRAYRRGFPQTYNWDDIINNYQAQGFLANGQADSYIYYNHFETAYWQLEGLLGPYGSRNPNASQQQTLAEIVNEIVQGQSLLGNQRLISALRIKYPMLLNPDATNATDRLPTPPNTRDQTAAIDVALLDYLAALPYPFLAIQEYGTGILRSRATPGSEPFPDFPLYLTILDPTLSQQPIPIKNEYWQLTSLLEKMSLGTVEKAKKLFRLSASDSTARQEAKEACKSAGIQGYLGMAVLAAAQSPDDFAANQGNSLLANISNARDLFNEINAGMNPLPDDNSFIPNESFSAIYSAAQSAVTTAHQAEIDARQESRTYDQYQADLRNEQQSQRASFITPLLQLTGIDPALYNNLQTVDDQRDYRNTVNQRVDTLLAAYPNADATGSGQYGAQVIAILDAGLLIQQRINDLNNIYETIKIKSWANDQVQIINNNATASLSANDIARGYANAFTLSASVTQTFGTAANSGTSISASISFNPGSIANGYLNADDRDIQRLQSAQIADINLEAEIRQSLLGVANLAIDIRRAKDAYDQEKLKLDSMLTQMNRYIEDLANARDTAANLYFSDPSFRIIVSHAQHRAEADMDYSIDKLYRLAKTLEYEWTEPYQNPVVVPVYCNEPASLENPLFDKFTELTDLFNAGDADEAGDYLGALQAWDSKLRRINGASVRGPNHAGPLTAEPISLREDVLGFKTTGPTAVSLAQSIQEFRAYLQQHRQTNYFAPLNPQLQINFSTTIADDSMFPATGSEWNMRIGSIGVDLLADQGFSSKQVANVGLIESGMASLRTFWANPPYADEIFKLTFNIGNPDRTAFGIIVPASINGATGGRPATEFINTGLADRPIAATRWVLTIDTSDPSNKSIDFSKLDDIIIRFTYTYGNPPQLFP